VIQLAGIVQYQAVNIIISRFFSSFSVTEYNIAYKYFSVLLMVFGIIMTPIWGAVSDAMAKNDYKWIHKIERQLLKVWLLGLGGAILSVYFF
jgi:O-antigen/teichoic acid export membrane protein